MSIDLSLIISTFSPGWNEQNRYLVLQRRVKDDKGKNKTKQAYSMGKGIRVEMTRC